MREGRTEDRGEWKESDGREGEEASNEFRWVYLGCVH